MKVARFYAPGDIRLEDADEPQVSAGEVKIRVRSCSTCGTDAKIFRSGHPNMSAPQVMGHEIAGEIVDVGDGAGSPSGDTWSVGDRVQVIAAIPDGTCPDCLAGNQTICPNQLSMGYQFPGGFAEYMIVPNEVLRVDGLNRIPDGLSFAEASLAEPLACVLNGQELARVGEGDVVVVMGSGPIGCLHVRLARSRGASRVILIDINGERLAEAASLVKPDLTIDSSAVDAVQAVLDATDGRGADVVLEVTGNYRALQEAIRTVAYNSRVCVAGFMQGEGIGLRLGDEFHHNRVQLVCAQISGVNPSIDHRWNEYRLQKTFIDLAVAGKLRVTDLISHEMPLEKGGEAFQLLDTATSDVLQVVLNARAAE